MPHIVFRPRSNMHQFGFGRDRKAFRMNEMHTDSPFQRDYATSRTGNCKHVMTSTAESKRILNCVCVCVCVCVCLIPCPVAKAAW